MTPIHVAKFEKSNLAPGATVSNNLSQLSKCNGQVLCVTDPQKLV